MRQSLFLLMKGVSCVLHFLLIILRSVPMGEGDEEAQDPFITPSVPRRTSKDKIFFFFVLSRNGKEFERAKLRFYSWERITLNPLSPTSDLNRISPYTISTISS